MTRETKIDKIAKAARSAFLRYGQVTAVAVGLTEKMCTLSVYGNVCYVFSMSSSKLEAAMREDDDPRGKLAAVIAEEYRIALPIPADTVTVRFDTSARADSLLAGWNETLERANCEAPPIDADTAKELFIKAFREVSERYCATVISKMRTGNESFRESYP